MDFQSFYKINSSVLSTKNCKRKVANDIRAHKRSELYHSKRNISVSPSPKQYIPISEQKENFKPPTPETPDKLRDAENTKINEKLSHKKAHFLKFLAWKTEKAKKAQLKENSKFAAPFVVPTRQCTAAKVETLKNLKKYDFAPANYKFKPPANLKDLEVKVVGANSIKCINGAHEATCHFLATPKKKIKNGEKNKITVNAKQILGPKSVIPNPTLNIESKSLVQSNKKVQPKTFAKSNQKAPTSPGPGKTQLRPISIPLAATTNIKTVPAKHKAKPLTQHVSKSHLKPSTLSPKQKNNFPRPKACLPPIKRTAFKAPKNTKSSISNAFKTISQSSRTGTDSGTLPLKKHSGKSIQTLTRQTKNVEPVPETPTDTNPVNPFLKIVTSTKRKSFSSKQSDANSLLVEMDKLVSPMDDMSTCPAVANGNKFNFIRYSVVQSNENKLQQEGEDDKRTEERIDITPQKSVAEPQTPTAYLSPYVSVSRGKVGPKAEREKRNSIYMSVDTNLSEDHDTTSRVRHTLATVHYYRKQLSDEIDRLNKQCDFWEQYKDQNAQLLEDAGSDMINVTIGQTKLLITKKLKQFGDLIDRCEEGVMGKKLLCKGDGAKPILTEDLEGFWSMVGLQIENVDKRFANLQRWKENSWKDPDEVQLQAIRPNGNIKKIKKSKLTTTTGPNRDLQKILKSAQAAFLRKKTANGVVEEDIILTPSKKREVLIRDRRSRSTAATVITINAPKASRRSSVIDQTTPTGTMTGLKSNINDFRKSFNLLKSTLLIAQAKKSPAKTDCTSPLPASRKSILKTPGSLRRPKSVIFNSPALKFTIEDKIESESPPCCMLKEPEKEERTYTLRNRNIKLRDSAGIIIPK